MAAKILDKINVPKVIAAHVVGKHHSEKHHMVAGVLVMFVGVLIGKAAVLVDFALFHIFAETFGAAVHGVGLVPFLDYLLKAEGAK